MLNEIGPSYNDLAALVRKLLDRQHVADEKLRTDDHAAGCGRRSCSIMIGISLRGSSKGVARACVHARVLSGGATPATPLEKARETRALTCCTPPCCTLQHCNIPGGRLEAEKRGCCTCCSVAGVAPLQVLQRVSRARARGRSSDGLVSGGDSGALAHLRRVGVRHAMQRVANLAAILGEPFRDLHRRQGDGRARE